MYEQSLITEGVQEEASTTAQYPGEPGPCGSSSWVDGEDASLSISHIGDSVFFSTSSSHIPPRESHSLESDAADESDPLTTQERSDSETQLVPFREESPKPHQLQLTTISTFSFLPSLRFSPIPRQFHTPLLALYPELFQVSDKTSPELDMTLCVFPFFGCSAWSSRELSLFCQSSYSATAIETPWDLSHGSQARRCGVWRRFKHRRPSVLRLRHGFSWGIYLC